MGRSFHVGFKVNKVTLGDVFLTVLLFCPVSIIAPVPRTHSVIGDVTDVTDLLKAS
jgi:hypothetical protein